MVNPFHKTHSRIPVDVNCPLLRSLASRSFTSIRSFRAIYVAYMDIYPTFPYISASWKLNTLYPHACTPFRVLISILAFGI